jgi:hypothetical protein
LQLFKVRDDSCFSFFRRQFPLLFLNATFKA